MTTLLHPQSLSAPRDPAPPDTLPTTFTFVATVFCVVLVSFLTPFLLGF